MRCVHEMGPNLGALLCSVCCKAYFVRPDISHCAGQRACTSLLSTHHQTLQLPCSMLGSRHRCTGDPMLIMCSQTAATADVVSDCARYIMCTREGIADCCERLHHVLNAVHLFIAGRCLAEQVAQLCSWRLRQVWSLLAKTW